MPWDVQRIVQAGGLKIEFSPAALKDGWREVYGIPLVSRSGLKVSSVAMGTMTFGGIGWAQKKGI